MVLYTIIGEYDVLYAQERELAGYCADMPKAVQTLLSTNPRDFLETTALPKIAGAEPISALLMGNTLQRADMESAPIAKIINK